jgi:acyl-ACP thioesterase
MNEMDWEKFDEKSLSYTVEIDVADLNEYNLLKPYGYLRIINRVIETHLNHSGTNVEETMRHGLAWAWVSVSLEIRKPITGLMELEARTWYSKRLGPYFRREFSFCDDKGCEVFRGSSFSILLDIEKRSVFRKKEIPFSLMLPIGGETIAARPQEKHTDDFKIIGERRVYNSHIDCLGHVNNGRYLEFAYDALDEREKKALAEIKRIDIYFLKELKLGENFQLLKSKNKNNCVVRCAENKEACFEAVFNY